MKLHLDSPSDNFVIEACNGDVVRVSGEDYRRGIVLTPRGIADIVVPPSLDQLSAECLRAVALLQPRPEIFLLGAGRYSPPYRVEWLAEFAKTGASLEVMSLPAACRTYNILQGDGRDVAAVLVIEAGGG